MTIFAFDIDGTICSNTYGKYELAEPFKTRINFINNLYESGHTIKMFTARGSTTNKDWFKFTQDQITNWGLKYHELILGKPEADIFIDDKAINQNEFDWETFKSINIKMHTKSQQYFKKISDAFLSFSFNKKNINKINEIAYEIANVLNKNGKVIFAGNGGSFADSQHLSAEFISKLNRDRSPLAAITLGTNSSSLSAIGNDYGFEFVFSRELEAIHSKKDIVIAISTSGKSRNIIELLKKANSLGIKSALLTGPNKNTPASLLCNWVITTPKGYDQTAEIQHLHISIGHLICDIAQQDFI